MINRRLIPYFFENTIVTYDTSLSSFSPYIAQIAACHTIATPVAIEYCTNSGKNTRFPFHF